MSNSHSSNGEYQPPLNSSWCKRNRCIVLGSVSVVVILVMALFISIAVIADNSTQAHNSTLLQALLPSNPRSTSMDQNRQPLASASMCLGSSYSTGHSNILKGYAFYLAYGTYKTSGVTYTADSGEFTVQRTGYYSIVSDLSLQIPAGVTQDSLLKQKYFGQSIVLVRTGREEVIKTSGSRTISGCDGTGNAGICHSDRVEIQRYLKAGDRIKVKVHTNVLGFLTRDSKNSCFTIHYVGG